PAEESGAAIEADAELQHGGGWDATGRQVGMRAIDTVQDKTQRRNRVAFSRNRWFWRAGRPCGGDARRFLRQLLRGLAQGAAFHGGDEVQHRAAGATRETVKYVALQVGMKSVTAFPAVDGTESAVLIPAAAAQRHL